MAALDHGDNAEKFWVKLFFGRDLSPISGDNGGSLWQVLIWFVARDNVDRLEVVAWPSAAMIGRTNSKKLASCCSRTTPTDLFWVTFLAIVASSVVDLGISLFSMLRGVRWKCWFGRR